MTHRYTHGHAESVLRSHRDRTVANSVVDLVLRHPRDPGLVGRDVGRPDHRLGAGHRPLTRVPAANVIRKEP